MNLRTVDAVDITVVVDNVTDGLSSTAPEATSELATLLGSGRLGGSAACLCCAAHGLSLLITTHVGGETRTLLFDTGPEASVFDRNTQRLGVDLGQVDEIVLSHGHWDHCGAVLVALDRIRAGSNRLRTPVHTHPHMFGTRGLRLPNGNVSWMDDVPGPEQLSRHGADVLSSRAAITVLDDTVYSSGEIPRVTAYERGMPNQVVLSAAGEIEPDEAIADERWIAVDVSGRGLVIFTACSHAGIGNILAHCASVHDRPIYGVVGGLHLAGPNEALIEPSIDAIATSGATFIAPGHCTGWRATSSLANRQIGTVQPLATGMRLRLELS